MPPKTGLEEQLLSTEIMKTQFSQLLRFTLGLGLAGWAAGPQARAQTSAQLGLQLYAGLTITGAVGTVYSVEYVTGPGAD